MFDNCIMEIKDMQVYLIYYTKYTAVIYTDIPL